nr:tripartite motif-containing protein 10-like [Pogona vitticeps]
MLLMAVRSLFGVRSRSRRNETRIERKARREGDTVMAAEGLVEEFCDEITCPICLSSFQDPVILVECGHNFCRACLTGCWDEAEGCCPYCRRRVSTESFRANRQLGNLVGLVKRLQERREADMERGVCLRHQEPLKLFCKDDGAPICVVCDRSKEHRTHEVVPAEEAAETYKQVVKIHQKSLEKERKKLVDEKLAEEQKCQMYLGGKGAETEERTAHSSWGACEREYVSELSSIRNVQEEVYRCVEGILIDIGEEVMTERRAMEVCLSGDQGEEKGEERDLIVWEEVIKEGDGMREFSIQTEQQKGETRDCAIQTEREEEAWAKVGNLLKYFPNLNTGGGLLPDPEPHKAEKTVVVYPCNQGGGRRAIRPSPSYNVPPLEGDWARHPCCGTVCTVRSIPLRRMTDRERFGPAPIGSTLVVICYWTSANISPLHSHPHFCCVFPFQTRIKSLAGMVKITFEQQRTFLEEKEHLLLTQLRDLLIEFKKRQEENILRLSEDISHLGGQITEMEEKCQQPPSKFLQDIRSTLSRYEGKRQVRQLVEDSPELEEKIRDCVQTNVVVMKAMKKCKESLNEALNKVKVTLDPKTANPRLILSENQKKARWEIIRQNLPDNPERFDVMPCVLGCEGFCSGRRWWEVRVDPEVEVEERGWIMWAVGITRESGLRKGRISPSPNEGIWAIGKTSYPFTSCQLSAFASPEPTPLTLRQELRKIRVSLDYEDGRVEFFDADTDHLIFTFPSASFDGEKVYPYFWVGWGVQLTC